MSRLKSTHGNVPGWVAGPEVGLALLGYRVVWTWSRAKTSSKRKQLTSEHGTVSSRLPVTVLHSSFQKQDSLGTDPGSCMWGECGASHLRILQSDCLCSAPNTEWMAWLATWEKGSNITSLHRLQDQFCDL